MIMYGNGGDVKEDEGKKYLNSLRAAAVTRNDTTVFDFFFFV